MLREGSLTEVTGIRFAIVGSAIVEAGGMRRAREIAFQTFCHRKALRIGTRAMISICEEDRGWN